MILKRLCVCSVLFLGCAAAQRQVVQPKDFATGRPFSPGVWAGNTLYVAGQIGSDLKTGKVPDVFEDEVKTCLNNIGVILKEAGLSFDDVVTVNVYLTDMALFPRMNAVYTTFFREPRPARTTVGVAGLAGNAKIEITVTAYRNNAKK
jgi:2-iminobutanoate/2-iminopropanoate deaminase